MLCVRIHNIVYENQHRIFQMKDSGLVFFCAKMRGEKRMEYYMKLPRNKKEQALFMLIISVISVNIIAPVITMLEMGFSLEVYKNALHTVPLIWPVVIALVLLTEKPAGKLAHKILKEGDSFDVVMLVNAMCCVLLMSVILTVVGTWIGMRQISMAPFYSFFNNWPRNAAISFAVEAVIAQPIARFAMEKFHLATEQRMPSFSNMVDFEG